jgi:hypothetical protein
VKLGEIDNSRTEALRDELEAAPGSFMLQLRCDLRWDAARFRCMTEAMLAYVRARDPEADIPRWVAEGYWYLSWYVKSWSEHPSFPRPLPAEYYNAAYERLSDLAYWLFRGVSSSADDAALERALPGEPANTS